MDLDTLYQDIFLALPSDPIATYDHILARYFSQNKTLKLVYCGYSWPSLCTDIQQFCKSYITFIQSKPQCHKPYGSLKLFSIPEQL